LILFYEKLRHLVGIALNSVRPSFSLVVGRLCIDQPDYSLWFEIN
jgi:hypothetical protein